MTRTDLPDLDPVDIPDGPLAAVAVKALDASLGIHQQLLAKYVAKVREDRPDATPGEVIEQLESQFIRTVTVAGAAVGGTAAIPGFGTVAALGFGAGEVVAFLEAATLFTLSVAHVHGIDVDDPERRRALVLTVLLGESGRTAIGKAAKRLPGPIGGIVAGKLSVPAVREINRSLIQRFLRRFILRQGTLMFGRLVPFGVGAVIGGSGNRMLGRNVVRGARETFGPPPARFPSVSR